MEQTVCYEGFINDCTYVTSARINLLKDWTWLLLSRLNKIYLKIEIKWLCMNRFTNST